MAETVYRLLPGDGIALEESAGTKTVTISVPGLATKLNNGDIVQATQLLPGIAEIATNAEVQAGTDPDRIVTPAGLAAASQAALNDATASRLMRVGGFGLGGGALVLNGQDLNSERPTGFYYCNSCLNGPIATTVAGDGWLLHRDHSVSGYASQMYDSGVTDRVFFRRQVAGAWSSWREIYHTSNFDPNAKANTSGNYPGLSVGSSAQLGNQTDAMLAPPGMIAHFAMPSPPSGWLAANGAAVSRATYAALFAAIGATYGAGNGSSTFNLPDLRGMFHRSWDAGRGMDSGRPFGSYQGSANLSHSHTAQADGVHSHTMGSAGAHAHPYTAPSQRADVDRGNQFSQWSIDELASLSTGTAGDHTHTLNSAGYHSHAISAEGAGEARPMNVALLSCIKH